MATAIPKIIWTLWMQGWEAAPRVARASAQSWAMQNPDWRVQFLDRRTLSRFLPSAEIQNLVSDEHSASQSDQIRIALLRRYGGVWADATTVCVAPLDSWLPLLSQSGFFAFDKPAADRMLASWFLAAERGSYIVERWYEASWDYWRHQPRAGKLEDYFWFHHEFGKLYDGDREFKRIWDETPVVSAVHDGHFAPEDGRLLAVVDDSHVPLLDNPPSTVFKLTHKLSAEPPPGSLLDKICAYAEALKPTNATEARKRLLVTWYGSFAGHGTVGDALALNTLVTHLVGRGHSVSHATSDPVDIIGSERVQWDGVEPSQFDAVLFVCGPILSFHPQTNALFTRFSGAHLAGVGVSMMPSGHLNHTDPFDVVFAREGLADRHGDLAIVAASDGPAQRAARTKIGLSLRGYQTEYGEDRCKWRETEALARDLAQAASEQLGAEIVEIENHLARSGLTTEEIERQYAECALVITSRFHGAIAALRQNIPFIAIDQIEGGAKLMSLLSPLPWPHVYSIDQINAEELRRATVALVKQPDHAALVATRNVCIGAANQTLAALDEWLATLG